MVAENTRFFKGHRAVELITLSPDPSAHKRIGRGVRNVDSAVWDRENQNAVLSSTCQIHAESRHEKSPFEHWQQSFG